LVLLLFQQKPLKKYLIFLFNPIFLYY